MRLEDLAKVGDPAAALIMCRLALTIGALSERNAFFIGKIESLSSVDQYHLMETIQQVGNQYLRLYILKLTNKL